MSIIVSITTIQIMVIPVPSHPIVAWYMHLWIHFSMLVTALKKGVISCYVPRYITLMAWMGSYFLIIFKLDYTLFRVQECVCCWWMIFAACCSRGFHLGQKIQTIQLCCTPRSCSCGGFNKTEVHPQILWFSWNKHAQHTLFFSQMIVLDNFGIMG